MICWMMLWELNPPHQRPLSHQNQQQLLTFLTSHFYAKISIISHSITGGRRYLISHRSALRLVVGIALSGHAVTVRGNIAQTIMLFCFRWVNYAIQPTAYSVQYVTPLSQYGIHFSVLRFYFTPMAENFHWNLNFPWQIFFIINPLLIGFVQTVQC